MTTKEEPVISGKKLQNYGSPSSHVDDVVFLNLPIRVCTFQVRPPADPFQQLPQLIRSAVHFPVKYKVNIAFKVIAEIQATAL